MRTPQTSPSISRMPTYMVMTPPSVPLRGTSRPRRSARPSPLPLEGGGLGWGDAIRSKCSLTHPLILITPTPTLPPQGGGSTGLTALAKETGDGGPGMLVGSIWVEDGKLHHALVLLDDRRDQSAESFKVSPPNFIENADVHCSVGRRVFRHRAGSRCLGPALYSPLPGCTRPGYRVPLSPIQVSVAGWASRSPVTA